MRLFIVAGPLFRVWSAVGVNSVLSSQCSKWCPKQCPGIQQNITAQISEVFVGPRCTRGPAPMSEFPLTIEDAEVGVMHHFCYLGDILSCEWGAERAATFWTADTSKKRREISSPLTSRHVPLSSWGSIYNVCIRSVLPNGSEMWGMTKKITDRI